MPTRRPRPQPRRSAALCATGMRQCSLDVTVMPCVIGRVPARSGRACHVARESDHLLLYQPAAAGAATDPPAGAAGSRCCIRAGVACSVSAGGRSSLRRRWWRARDMWAGRCCPGGGTVTGPELAGGRCIMSRLGALYVIKAMERPAAVAGPRCRAGVPLITGPPRPAVPTAARAPSRGGCWPWCTAPSAALAAELAQAATGSATRRGRSEYRPGAHAAGHRSRQMAAWRGASGHAGDRTGAPMGDRGRPSQGRVLRAVALQGSSGRATWQRGGRHVFSLTAPPLTSSPGTLTRTAGQDSARDGGSRAGCRSSMLSGGR